MNEKEIKKLKSKLLENDFLKILARISFQLAFTVIYYYMNKVNENLIDISMTLMAIYLAGYAINISIYFNIYSAIAKNIEEIENNESANDIRDLEIKYLKKLFNRTLTNMIIIGIIICISSFIIITLNITPLIHNTIGVFAFVGTISLLITLLSIVRVYHKIY